MITAFVKGGTVITVCWRKVRMVSELGVALKRSTPGPGRKACRDLKSNGSRRDHCQDREKYGLDAAEGSLERSTQMRKLKITGVIRTVLLVLTVTGILLFFLLTAMDRRKLQRTVDDTIAFARARIQRYEDFNTNDKVKSLIRLLDKSTELSRVIAAEGIPDQEKLDRYVEDQRLSGVLILDENMRVVLQNSQDGITCRSGKTRSTGRMCVIS